MPTIDLEHIRQQVLTRLPRRVRWRVKGTAVDYSFSLSRQPLEPVREEDVGGGVEPQWRTLRVFGIVDYAEGGGAQPYLCVNSRSGKVVRLDVEYDPRPIQLLNASIELFISTFLTFDEAMRRRKGLQKGLASRAKVIDPESYARSEWRLLAEHLQDD